MMLETFIPKISLNDFITVFLAFLQEVHHLLNLSPKNVKTVKNN